MHAFRVVAQKEKTSVKAMLRRKLRFISRFNNKTLTIHLFTPFP